MISLCCSNKSSFDFLKPFFLPTLPLKHLRKTYITQVYKLLDNDTGLVTSHSSDKVLRNHYVEQKTLSATEKLSINLSFLN